MTRALPVRAAVSDLKKRDRDVDGERIGNERTAGGAKFTFGAKKVVDECWIGPRSSCYTRTIHRKFGYVKSQIKER